jgi:hypothetical protein
MLECQLALNEAFELGDKKVIRRSIHNTTAIAGTLTALGMRSGFAWGGCVFASLEQPNYQPEQRDLGRAEQLI